MTPAIPTVELSTGVTLPYVEQGDPAGIPVILLHGLSNSWRSFEHVLPQLPPDVRAFALTQRGHGDADHPDAGYRPEDFANDLAAFLDAVGIDAAIIAGHSLGAFVAQRFALDHPERTLGLVQIGSFTTVLSHPETQAFWDEVIAPLSDPVDPGFVREFQESTMAQPISPTWFDSLLGESLKVPAHVWKSCFRGLMEADHGAELGEIAAPTLIVWGDRDEFCLREEQDALVAGIPNSELLVYSGVGHAPNWEQPDRLAADIVAFARRVAGRPVS